MTMARQLMLLAAAIVLLGAGGADRPEPGKQGESLEADNPGAVLAEPYRMGLTRIGHDPIRGRDSNVQMAWAGHCAYVSSTGGPFPLIGVKRGDPELTGVAVIDVRNPRRPRTVRMLRDGGSIAALEALHAVEAPGRKVLVAGAYHGGANAAGTSGTGHDPAAQPAWLSIYDVSDCANPRLMSEVQWPENSHSVRLSPDGRKVYGTQLSPFTGKGGIQVMDISDLSRPRFLGKFGATRADGTGFEFAAHEVSFSPDGARLYAGVIASEGGDLSRGVRLMPPSRASMGPDGGGIYVFDQTDFLIGRPDPKLRLISAIPGGGWHSVVPARIGGKNFLVGGAELTGCPGTWPRLSDISDERAPRIAGEFRLAMNHAENCPPPGPTERMSGGIVPGPGTATLHYNDVDSPTETRIGLFNFMWAGLRVADLTNPAAPREVAYFKPGDVCTGHVHYLPRRGQIWLVCNASGFHVLELRPELRRVLR